MRSFAIALASLLPCLAAPPNIVHIISDDMGYSDLGCYGGEIRTPQLDALAAGGLRFTHFFVNNMCWPTRASLMTGLYPKSALWKGGSASGGLHPDATTLPQALKDAGYSTFMSGKWHLSKPGEPNGPNAPQHRGFDKFYGTIYGASDFFAPVDLALNGKSMTHEWEDKSDYYYTNAKTDHALTFLRERDAKKPFYLYLSYTAAHWPLHAKPDDIAAYKGHFADGWDRLREARHTRMKALGVIDPAWPLSPRHPNVPAWEDEPHPAWQERRMEVYAAQVTSMDQNIGRVVAYLKENELFDNTLIVYHQDNGGCHVEYPPTRTGSWSRERTTDGNDTPVRPGNLPTIMPGPQSTFQSVGYGWANLNNTPFRQFKQYDYEGGTRSPMVLSWPDGIEKRSPNGIVGIVSHAIDLMPTLLDVAGVSLPDQKPLPVAGISFAPVLTGKRVVSHEMLFWDHAKGQAVRSREYKLVREGKQAWELYKIREDGTEMNDLAAQDPERVKALAQQHAKWMKQVQANKTNAKK